MIHTSRWFLPLLTICYCSLAHASEVVFPATQIERGGSSVILYYTHTDQKLTLSTGGREQITVGGNSYFSEVNSDLACDGKREGIAAKMMFNPHGGFAYWLNAGSASYELSVPSMTVRNTYTTQNNGFFAGAGIRKVLFPDTLFTPAIAVDGGIRYDLYDVNEFRSGGNRGQRVATEIELTELQAALTISKVFKQFEPYGGIKVFRTYARLSDRESMENVSGVKDNAGLFFGTRIKIYQKEFISIEGSCIGENNLAAGLNIEF